MQQKKDASLCILFLYFKFTLKKSGWYQKILRFLTCIIAEVSGFA